MISIDRRKQVLPEQVLPRQVLPEQVLQEQVLPEQSIVDRWGRRGRYVDNDVTRKRGREGNHPVSRCVWQPGAGVWC